MKSPDIPQFRLYANLAWLWPYMSPPEDYAEEAPYWINTLRAHLGPGRHKILELGVGGGHNLSHLTGEFDAAAVDLSEGMLANSRRLNPTVEHHQGDMRAIRLGRTFDAVIIHDAISYLLTEDDLRATFATAAAHLEPGGVFITSPDLVTETFVDGYTACRTRPMPDGTITYVEYQWDPDPSDTRTDTLFTYIIRRGGEVQVELDRHTFGLFPKADWLRLLGEGGFAVSIADYPVHEAGREGWLFVGIKR